MFFLNRDLEETYTGTPLSEGKPLIETDPEYKAHCEKILQNYDKNDIRHNRSHYEEVLSNAHELLKIRTIKDLLLNKDMVTLTVIYHDSTLWKGGENHEETAAQSLKDDAPFLKKFFLNEEIDIMAQAIKEHGHGPDLPPSTNYGKILADADAVENLELLIEKTYERETDENDSTKEKFNKVFNNLKGRLGTGGSAKFHFKETLELKKLKEMRKMFDNNDMESFKSVYQKVIEVEIIESFILR